MNGIITITLYTKEDDKTVKDVIDTDRDAFLARLKVYIADGHTIDPSVYHYLVETDTELDDEL